MTHKIKITLPSGESFELDAHIDDGGVERYVANAVIDIGFNEGLVDLNRTAAMCQRLNIPLKDRIIYWSMLGYSVCGMCDLSFMYPVRVETPNWVKEPDDSEDE